MRQSLKYAFLIYSAGVLTVASLWSGIEAYHSLSTKSSENNLEKTKGDSLENVYRLKLEKLDSLTRSYQNQIKKLECKCGD